MNTRLRQESRVTSDRVLMIHGLLDPDGRWTLKRLGLPSAVILPGFMGPITAGLSNRLLAKCIAELVDGEVIGIGHSNGCPILVRAAEQGARFSTLILINPALDYDYPFPPGIGRIYVFWTPSDFIVFLSGLVPFARWGAMGATGYKGRDGRVTNVKLPAWSMHVGAFRGERLNWLKTKIAEILGRAS